MQATSVYQIAPPTQPYQARSIYPSPFAYHPKIPHLLNTDHKIFSQTIEELMDWTRRFTLFPEPLSQLLRKLLNANLVTKIPKPMLGPLPKGFNHNLRYAFHKTHQAMIQITVVH